MSFFIDAKPIFLKDLDKEHNVITCFKKNFEVLEDVKNASISITARSFYRLYVNDVFVMHGPARTAHKFLRVDDIDISLHVKKGMNEICIYVISYSDCFNGYSNDCTLERGLLLFELALDDRKIVSDRTVKGYRMIKRINAGRISHSRGAGEIYVIDDKMYEEHEVEELELDAFFLERGMEYPELDRIDALKLLEFGSFVYDDNINVPQEFYEPGYKEYYDGLEYRPDKDARRFARFPSRGKFNVGNGECEIIPGEDENPYVIFDFGKSHVGFFSLDLEIESCEEDAFCDIHHSEAMDLTGNMSIQTGGSIRLFLKKKNISFISMEPYLARYIRLCFKGVKRIVVRNVSIYTYYYPDSNMGFFRCSDEDLNRLYDAARHTLLLNTLDIFMDCPERERGGWLCDSLWTARSASVMLGDTSVEKAFIENFLLTPSDEMWNAFFPEVYPANKRSYKEMTGITTWSFWLMIEMCEYVERTNDWEFAEKFRQRIFDFVKGSKVFLGECGLLTNMPHVFVDWSKSNHYTQPISVSANSLYSYMLLRLGKLYGCSEFVELGLSIRSILRETVKDEKYIPDTLEYVDGKLRCKGNYSEANQYTVLWSELFDKDEIKELAFKVVHAMGPYPTYPKDPYVDEAGLFIGLCIRLDLLSKWKEYDKMLEDMKAIFYPQLKEGPGTLWENRTIDTSSRCHGFASHVGVHLTRDVLGLGIPDEVDKTITISPNPNGLMWAKGIVRTKQGFASLSWHIDGDVFNVKCSVPKGYKVLLDLSRNLQCYKLEIDIME